MSDPPGVQAALGIEAVQWSADGENLVLRITGRWRRRRPAYGGQPTLVVESQGTRHRFPATPEPPGLTGTPPGIWRISFTVPAALAPDLVSRSWLLFGGVVVRLPEAVEAAQTGALPGAHEVPTPAESTDPAPGLGSGPVPGPRQLGAEPPVPQPPPARVPEPPELPPAQAPEPAEPPQDTDPPAWVRADRAMSELAERIGGLERALGEARAEASKLVRRAARSDRARRAVEQVAHAERNRRRELEQELIRRERRAARSREALADLASSEARVRELERELMALRRQVDEAEHAAAAAHAARERAERREAELTRAGDQPVALQPPPVLALRRGLGREREMVARQSAAASHSRVADEPVESPAAPRGPAGADPGAPLEQVVEALRGEIEARAVSEARLRARLGVAEGRFETRSSTEDELTGTLAQLRAELASLRSDLQRERSARCRAEQRAAGLEQALVAQRTRADRANAAIEELRVALEAVRAAKGASPPPERRPVDPPHAPRPAPEPPHAPPASPEPEAAPESEAEAEPGGGEVEPERFSDALVRLRERIAPADDADVRDVGPTGAQPPPEESDERMVVRPWLEPAFRELARRNAGRAGRLLLELLPAQGAAYDGSVVYDLVLGRDFGSVAVTLRGGELQLASRASPREREIVDFQAFGSPARIARLLTAGPVRRLTRLGLARVRGDRRRVAALEALIRAPLSLADLHRAGVRMDPLLALTLISLMIDPAWVEGERFTLGLVEEDNGRATIEVRGRRRPVVREGAAARQVTTWVTVGTNALLALLAGDTAAASEVRGDPSALAMLLSWIKRAQSG